MPQSNPSPPQDATSTRRGLVSTLAQSFAGVKTFLARAVMSLGITSGAARLDLRSDLGASSSDVCNVVGSTVADGSVHSLSKLLSARTGIGGTEVEYLAVTKTQTTVAASGETIATFSAGGGIAAWRAVSYAFYVLNAAAGGIQSAGTMRLTSEAADGASAVAGRINTTTSWSNATSRLWSFQTAGVERSAIMSNGEFEHAVSGAGIVLRSPNGTRWRITVTNGGALNVAAA